MTQILMEIELTLIEKISLKQILFHLYLLIMLLKINFCFYRL